MKHKFELLNGFNTVTVYSEIEDGSDHAKVLLLLMSPGRHILPDLMFRLDNLGGHEVFEQPRKRTTTRKMRQIIRDLRDFGCPIVGDSKGLWVAQSTSEIEEFADHLEQKAKSDISSMMKLRRTMLGMIESDTPSLFDNIKINEPLPETALAHED